MKQLLVMLALLATLVTIAPAHEPLWGEAASTVGDRVWHPDVKFGFMSSNRLLNGTGRVANPTGLKRSMIEQFTSIDYGVGPRLNLRMELPVHRFQQDETIGGVPVTARYTEPGDVMLGAKYRYYLRGGRGFKKQQAVSFGLMLPTGETARRDSTGALVPAEHQPGTGSFGTMVGWQAARETTKDSLWLSAMARNSLGTRRFRPALDVEADASYGRWLKFPKSIPDLGTMLTVGLHAHWHGRNRVAGTLDPNSGESQFAMHSTFIAQQHQYQLRLGVLIPVTQGVNGVQLAERAQVRFGIEKFF